MEKEKYRKRYCKSTRIELDIGTILQECVKDYSVENGLIKNYKNYRKYLSDSLGIHLYNEDFLDTMLVLFNEEKDRYCLSFNPDEYIDKLCMLLNVDEKNYSSHMTRGVKRRFFFNKYIFEKLKHRLYILSDVKTLDELNSKFPLLYENYRLANDMLYRSLFEEDKEILRLYDLEFKKMQECGITNDFNEYIKKQYYILKNALNNTYNVFAFCAKSTSQINKLEYYDLEKLDLYICYKMLKVYETSSTKTTKKEMLEVIQYKLSKVTNFDVSLTDEYGVKISYKIIKKRLDNLLNTDKKIITNSKMFDGKGTGDKKDNSPRHKSPIDDIERKRLVNINERKKNFIAEYDCKHELSTNLLKKNQYKGYVLDNDIVIFDYIAYDDYHLKRANNNRMFVIYVDDVDDLKDMSKEELRKDGRCKVFNHTGNWEDRVNNYIKSKAK